MSYRTKFRRRALKELKKLPAHVRAEALEKIDRLRTRGARPLTQDLIDRARRSGRS